MCFRLRYMDKCCRTVEIAIGYSKYMGGGFKRAITLDQPTCLTEDVYEASLHLLKIVSFWTSGAPNTCNTKKFEQG
nr:hypothetical protein [Bacillus cereus]